MYGYGESGVVVAVGVCVAVELTVAVDVPVTLGATVCDAEDVTEGSAPIESVDVAVCVDDGVCVAVVVDVGVTVHDDVVDGVAVDVGVTGTPASSIVSQQTTMVRTVVARTHHELRARKRRQLRREYVGRESKLTVLCRRCTVRAADRGVG